MYNEKMFRPWVLGTPELYAKYQEIVEDQDGDDPFGKIALKKLYFNVILADAYWTKMYDQKYKDYTFTPDIELIELIEEKLQEYGWQRFFVALRLVSHRLLKKYTTLTVNGRRVEKSLELLDQVPRNVEL